MEFTPFQIALTLLLVINPIGFSPAILALVKNLPFKRQRFILIRESVIALFIALFFQFFGEIFMSLICVEQYTVSFTGGIILLLVSLEMIYPQPVKIEQEKEISEPFIVPIATPLLAGPGLLAMIMFFAKSETDVLTVSMGIGISGAAVILTMAFAPYLQQFFGKRGMTALEQLMGLMLSLVSLELIQEGIKQFIKTT